MRRIKRATAGDKSLGLECLESNVRNPRLPWKRNKQRSAFRKSLEEFGDLSGVVFNLTTKQLVGGHKRIDEFKEDSGARRIITDLLEKPDKTGTVAYGHVLLSSGVRFSYREVRWNPPKEAAGMLAANKWAAQWEWGAVRELVSLADTGGFELEITGFELGDLPITRNLGGLDKSADLSDTRYECVAECSGEAQQREVYELLTERGIKCRLLTL